MSTLCIKNIAITNCYFTGDVSIPGICISILMRKPTLLPQYIAKISKMSWMTKSVQIEIDSSVIFSIKMKFKFHLKIFGKIIIIIIYKMLTFTICCSFISNFNVHWWICFICVDLITFWVQKKGRNSSVFYFKILIFFCLINKNRII